MQQMLFVLFLLGLYSMVSQMLLVREMLVVFSGNELTIGVIFAVWFVAIAAGAWLIRRRLDGWNATVIRRTIRIGMILLAIITPAQIMAVRLSRAILHIPVGEYASLGAGTLAVFIVLLPMGVIVGALFPAACRWAVAQGDSGGVSRMYKAESIGALCGGLFFSFIIVEHLSPLRTAVLEGAIAVCALALMSGRRAWPAASLTAILLLGVALPYPWPAVENFAVTLRWRAAGLLSGEAGRAGQRVLADYDSKFQNLAVIGTSDHAALYANGEMMALIDDPAGVEMRIHFLMAQNPKAKAVLVIGGNPLGDIPELLRYPVSRLVSVDVDPGIARILGCVAPRRMEAIMRDHRVDRRHEDPWHYLRRAPELFDVVIVNAPDPVTIVANRFYTEEFFRSVRKILAPSGFVAISVESSERLETLPARRVASIRRSMQNVYGKVLVTAGSPTRFIAGGLDAGITFEREPLYRRSLSAELHARYFKPEYFLSADEIDADKVAWVARRLDAVEVDANTLVKPASCFHSLLLWSKFSESRIGAVLETAGRWGRLAARSPHYLWGILGVFLAGVVILGGWMTAGAGRSRCWMRWCAGLIIGVTGIATMAFELAVIVVYQSTCGWMYTRLGLITAAFMGGLAVGAGWAQNRMREADRALARDVMICLLLLLGLAMELPNVMQWSSGMAEVIPGVESIEIVLFAMMAAAGFSGGALFPFAWQWGCRSGMAAGHGVAVMNAMDTLGAAAGSAVTCVVILPVMGIEAVCLMTSAFCLIAVAEVLAVWWRGRIG